MKSIEGSGEPIYKEKNRSGMILPHVTSGDLQAGN